MKKIITLSLVSVLSTFLLVGCGSKTVSPEAETTNQESHTLELGKTSEDGRRHVCDYSQEHIYKMIRETGEKDGWIMTEFKSNAFIAEKIDGDDAKSVTVTFHGHSIDIEPENNELKNALSNALSHSKKESH